jgi:acyl-CoA synthetase (AMP-forming)/AMP-acid ligase II
MISNDFTEKHAKGSQMKMRARTFTDVLHRHLHERGSAECFVLGQTRVSWERFCSDVASLAVLLPSLVSGSGIRRIAINVEEPLGFLRAFFAALCVGSVVPLPTLRGPRAITAMLDDCDAGLVIASDRYLRDMKELAAPRLVVGLQELCERADLELGRSPKLEWLDHVSPECEMTVLYSSGTTSVPKGVVHSHAARCQSAERLARHYSFNPGCRSLIVAPLYSAAALSPIFGTLYAGGTSIILGDYATAGLIDVIKAERPTSLSMTPTQFLSLLDCPAFDPADFASCDFVQCGGAPLSPRLRETLYQLFPGNFVEGYGSTETDMISRMPPRASRSKWGSVGIPASDVEVRILRDGALAGADSVGEVVVSSTGQMTGYLGAREGTASFWTAEDGKVFFRTGDLGRIDQDGYLWLTGRAKDLVKTAGLNVYPIDIESVLLAHPDVADAAVVGVPHPTLGETPVAFVVLGKKGLRSTDICRWANAQLDATQKLFRVHVADTLPRNAAGKVEKHKLRTAAAGIAVAVSETKPKPLVV